MELSPFDIFELKAETFRIMTGHMAPGKDAAPGGYSIPYEEREALWREWGEKYNEVFRSMILVMHVIKDIEWTERQRSKFGMTLPEARRPRLLRG